MTSRRSALIGLLLVTVMLMTLPTARPALACSCAEQSLEDLVDRGSDVAVAVVRRIDRNAGSTGVGMVEASLHGSLPEQVPLQLDDGGSCLPYLDVGQIATLSFEPEGGSWKTMECGMLDAGQSFGAAFGPLQAEAGARGDPAVVLSGPLPGADLALLDSNLAPLATAELEGVTSVEACGSDSVLVTSMTSDETVLSRVSLPDLTVAAERRLDRAGAQRILDVRCGPLRAWAVTASDDEGSVTLYRNLFHGEPRELPPAEDAVIARREVLLLTTHEDTGRSEILAHHMPSGQTVFRRRFDDIAVTSIAAAPNGSHVVVRGHAQQPRALVMAAGGPIVGRSRGPWMPPESDPWLGDNRLVLVDESRSMGDPPRRARIVDLRLETVDTLPPMPTDRLVAGADVVAGVGGAELTIASPKGTLRSSDDPQTAAADDVAIVGEVSAARVQATEMALPDPEVPEPGQNRLWIVVALTAAGAVVAIGFLLVRQRRRRGRSAA